MKSLQNIVQALDGSRISAVVFDRTVPTVTIMHRHQPIFGVTWEQLEALHTIDAVDPHLSKLLQDHGLLMLRSGSGEQPL